MVGMDGWEFGCGVRKIRRIGRIGRIGGKERDIG